MTTDAQPMTEPTLAGRAGLITGAGSGIGAATAERLAVEGAHVLVTDRDPEAAESVASRIRTRGHPAHGAACDIRSLEQLTAARDTCLHRWGRMDFVIANAGLGDRGAVLDGDPERWRAVVDTNVWGTMLTARMALEAMAPAGRGDIVIVASLSGRTAYPEQASYIASKWAVVGYGNALRSEAQQLGIRVTLIEPGRVDTPLSRQYGRRAITGFEPLQPDDVAEAISYVLSRPSHVLIRELVLQPAQQPT